MRSFLPSVFAPEMVEASKELRTRLGRGSFVVVADRGMISAANLQALQADKIEYVIAERLRRATANEALDRAAEDARQRDAIVEQLQAKIAAGGVRDQLKNGAHRYLKFTGTSAGIDLKKVQEDARYGGMWVPRTTTSLPPEQVALAYRGLWRVADAFRTIETPLEPRSPFHTSEAGIRGHVQACVLAFALVRVIEDRLDAAGIDVNAKEALQDLAHIRRSPLARAGVTVTKKSSPTEQQRLRAARGAPFPERDAAV